MFSRFRSGRSIGQTAKCGIAMATMTIVTNAADWRTRLKPLPRSAARRNGEIEHLGYTIHPDAYGIDADVSIRGPRPGGEFLERRGRAAYTVPNEPNEFHVVSCSRHLSAGTASGPRTVLITGAQRRTCPLTGTRCATTWSAGSVDRTGVPMINLGFAAQNDNVRHACSRIHEVLRFQRCAHLSMPSYTQRCGNPGGKCCP